MKTQFLGGKLKGTPKNSLFIIKYFQKFENTYTFLKYSQKTHEKTQNSSKILKKLKPKFQKNSKTGNSSWVELAENCPKKACLMARFLHRAFLDWCIPFWERVQNVKDINKEFREHTCEYKNALSRKNKYSWKNLKHPFKGFSGLKKRIEQSEMPFDVKYEAMGIISHGVFLFEKLRS